jgi:predicted RNA-binding Zn ribbon-like protein
MSQGVEQDRPFKLIANRLCLDFANTVAWPSGEDSREPLHQYERFTSYAWLVAWSHHAGAISDDERDRLLERAAQDPAEAREILDRAFRLRAAIHWAFAALARRLPVDPAELAALNEELGHAFSRLRVVQEPDGFRWAWAEDAPALDRVLWPVVRSAAELLSSEEREQVRLCAGDPCGFLFLDTSRNRSRRWCVMQECGNRAKARRYYRRKQGDNAPRSYSNG